MLSASKQVVPGRVRAPLSAIFRFPSVPFFDILVGNSLSLWTRGEQKHRTIYPGAI